MSDSLLAPPRPKSILFGPEIPQAGSWDWLGRDLIDEFSSSDRFECDSFQNEIPHADLCVFIKWLPPLDQLRELAARAKIVFCPVDVYGGSAEIDADWRRLRLCDCVVLHTRLLEKYVRGYARTVCFDHHLKFTVPTREAFVAEGAILWTGVWANLPPLVEWVNQHPLPEELLVLTNFDGHSMRTPADFGFRSDRQVCIEEWSCERHLELLQQVRAAIDIKGDDFRQRHKPPAKALDLIAAGIPLAMNADSSSTRELRERGFEVATPDVPRWLAQDYWQATRQFGLSLHEHLSRTKVLEAWQRLFLELLELREDT